MKLILGIGNPGLRYRKNRHNIGFMFLDYIAENNRLLFNPSKFDFYFAESSIRGNEYALLKPTTNVNNSGIAARQAIEFYKTNVTDLLVICDEINIEFGSFKIRASGGDGGHKGVSSIIYHLNSDNFPRIRFGIGNQFSKGEMAEYVLSDFNDTEDKILANLFEKNYLLIQGFVENGLKGLLDMNSRLSASANEENSSKKLNED